MDAITIQILRNKIASLVDEMHYHFYRSGYSTIIRESRDFSCVIVDRDGRLIAIGNAASETLEVPGRDFRNRLGRIVGHTNFQAPREVKREAYTAMARHAAAGEIAVPVAERPLDEVAAAWEEQAASPHHKLVVRLR